MARQNRAKATDVSAAPPETYYKVTKADADLPLGPCRALLVGTAGTANLMRYDGITVTDVPLQEGYNPLPCKQVMLGGSAEDIWALQ